MQQVGAVFVLLGFRMHLRDCRVSTTLKVIRGKWKPLIITALKARCCLGYGELRRVLPEARKKILTEQLRQLEVDRVITRTVLYGKVVRVQYALTAYGRTLIPILASMDDWRQKHQQFLASVFPQDCPRQPKPAPGPYREFKERFDHRLERLERKRKSPLLDGLAMQAQA